MRGEVMAAVSKESRMKERKHRAIDMLAAGRHPEDVALELGVAAPAVARWRREPAFAARVYERQVDIAKSEVKSIQHLVACSLSTLDLLLKDPRTPASVRAKAAIAVLDRVGLTKNHDTLIEARIRHELERLLSTTVRVLGAEAARKVADAMQEESNVVDSRDDVDNE